MLTDVAHVSVVSRTAILGSCELCATEGVELPAIVVVKHSRGGSVSFVACDPCALAVRRVAAAAGGQARFTAVAEGGVVQRSVVTASRQPIVAAADAGPEVIQERADHLRDADGTEYLVRVCGRQRLDGIWEGWIEFVAIGAPGGLRTDAETTQPSRQDLAYWASGLEPLYFEGAFRRAHPAPPVG